MTTSDKTHNPLGVVVNGQDGQEDATRYEIKIGPGTKAHATQVLQQQLAPVWQAVIEAAGGDPAGGWQLVIDHIRLVRQQR